MFRFHPMSRMLSTTAAHLSGILVQKRRAPEAGAAATESETRFPGQRSDAGGER